MTKTQIALRITLAVIWTAFLGVTWSLGDALFSNGHGLGWPTYLVYSVVFGVVVTGLVFLTKAWWGVKSLPPL